MVIGIYANSTRDENETQKRRLAAALAANGIACREQVEAGAIRAGAFDVLCVLGGDGTILNVASRCADAAIPMLGVNLGSVGFLSGAEPGETEALAASLAAGSYAVEERAMLKTTYGGRTVTALNEFVLSREGAGGVGSRVITIDAYVGEELLDRYIGDGAIVSTPTGSTAYSLSAGGAVLSPKVAAIQITPICPHSLHTRPIVAADCERVRLSPRSKSAAWLYADGMPVGRAECDVVIERYEKCARFVKLRETGFYTRLLEKLNKWSTIKP